MAVSAALPPILPTEPTRQRPRQIEGEARPVPPVAQPRIKALEPGTVQAFRAMFPAPDPYACQADFYAWQAGLPPEKQAKRYSSAFLGFAKVWAKGKT
jgi:hypothetical protein